MSTYAITDENKGVAVDDLGPRGKRARKAGGPDLPTLEEPPAQPPPPSGAQVDARLEELDRLVSRGDWMAVEKAVAAMGDVSTLSPALQLLWAIGVKEGTPKKGQNPDRVAIEAAGALLGVPASSALAMVLGKRLVRKRSVTERPAPRPVVSWMIVLAGLAVGSAIGWFLA